MKNNTIKKLVIMLATGFILNSNSYTQKINESNVPSAAKTTFQKAFPGAASITWEMEEKNYEVNFKEEGKTMSATIDVNGTLIETETDIHVSKLPKAVTDYLALHYKDKKIKEAAIIKKANEEINYEAEVKGKDLLFNNKGEFIKEVKN